MATELETKLAEALGRLIDVSMVAMTDKDFATEQSIAIWNEAIEALRLYDEAKAQALTDLECPPDPDMVERALAQPVQDLPPLPEPARVAPVNFTPYYTADQMRDYARAALAATPAQEQQAAPFNPDWNKLEATQESLREHMEMLREIECPPDPETVDRALEATPAQAQQADGEVLGDARELRQMLADCEPYLKEGETPAQRIERERRDTDAALTLLIREKNITKQLREQLAATPAPAPSEQVVLTAASLAAMAAYPEGHAWDRLDAAVCKRAADMLAATPAPAPAQAQQAGFDAWWESEGQFCRAGGGDYERSFAWAAWRASTGGGNG